MKIEFRGAQVTNAAGLLAYRGLDGVLGLTTMVERLLVETRTGQNTRHGPVAHLRPSVDSRMLSKDKFCRWYFDWA